MFTIRSCFSNRSWLHHWLGGHKKYFQGDIFILKYLSLSQELPLNILFGKIADGWKLWVGWQPCNCDLSIWVSLSRFTACAWWVWWLVADWWVYDLNLTINISQGWSQSQSQSSSRSWFWSWVLVLQPDTTLVAFCYQTLQTASSWSQQSPPPAHWVCQLQLQYIHIICAVSLLL